MTHAYVISDIHLGSPHCRRDGVRYVNTGSWTESPSHYLDIDEKEMTLKNWK